MQNEKITIIIPTTPDRRPRLLELLDSIEKNTADMSYVVAPYENELGGWVPAVHAAISGMGDDEFVVLLGSDVVVQQGWLSTLWRAFCERFPDRDGAAQPFDEINHGRLCQHPLAKVSTIRKYLDPRFIHNYSDNWMTECLVRDGKYLYVPEAKIEHRHFINGKAKRDKTYDAVFNKENWAKDQALYNSLRREEFQKNAPPKKAGGKAKVMIAVPTDGSHIHIELARRLIVWSRSGALVTALAGVRPVDHARNEAVRVFMRPEYADFTHLFFVDDDTVPPFDAIDKLLALDADVASGITKILRMDDPKGEAFTAWNCFLTAEEDENGSRMLTVDEDTGVQKIIRAGTSCMLIKRDTLEKVGCPWFQTVWKPDYSGYKSEDIAFCDKVVELGMTILCDTSVKCGHFKGVMLE